jgi:hypothetical protein
MTFPPCGNLEAMQVVLKTRFEYVVYVTITKRELRDDWLPDASSILDDST